MQLGRIFANYLATQKNYYSIYQIFDRYYYKNKGMMIKNDILNQISMMSTKDLHFINNKISGEIAKRNMNEKMKFEMLLKKKQ